MRATAPRKTTKRDPDSRPAVSKSMPAFTPAMSKCSLAFWISGGVPQRCISTLSSSSAPSGTSSYPRFGMVNKISFSAISCSLAFAVISLTSAFFSATRVRNLSNSVSSPLALAAPTDLEALFCSACAVSAANIAARLALSISKMDADIEDRPRRANAASKATGFSRMTFISCIGNLLFGTRRSPRRSYATVL